MDGKARQTPRSKDWPNVRRNPPNPDERCKPYDRDNGTGSGDRGGRGGRGRRGRRGGGHTISFGYGSKAFFN